MDQISEVIQTNREWLGKLFDRHDELQHIKDLFEAHMKDDHGGSESPRIATGHQPVIYYPGLLFKDYFVGETVKAHGGSAWNLIVDSDEAHLKVPVPYMAKGELHKTFVQIPNEEKQAFTGFNPSLNDIEGFLQSTADHVATLPHEGIRKAFETFQTELIQCLRADYDLFDTLSLLRNRFDAYLGCSFNEVKVSHLVTSHPYWQYLWYIIKNIDSYRQAYNQAVAQGKRKNYQPVKFLSQKKDWFELPFWLEQGGRRLPVMMRRQNGELTFRSEEDGATVTVSTANKSESRIIQDLQDSIVLYPKATTLTQIIRLFLSDVFVHGKGAVEYERINNAFLEDFFGMDSRLAFYSVTGDIPLPLAEDIPDYRELQETYQQKQKWLSQVDRNPEEYLPDDLAEQYKRKKKEVAQKMSGTEIPGERKKFHEQLEQLDQEMKKHLTPQIDQVRKELNRYDALLQKKEVFYERQYPYFLYPAKTLTREAFADHIQISSHA